jgi:hypothetical protein
LGAIRCTLPWPNVTTAPKAAPVTVRLLLKLEPTLVNPPPEDEGLNPFLFLLYYVTEISARSSSDELRESIKKCLILWLDAKLNPTPTVFAALRGLPYWLFPTAILSSTVKDRLNEKIRGRFPTVILMLDFYVQVLVIFFFVIIVPSLVRLITALGTRMSCIFL